MSEETITTPPAPAVDYKSAVGKTFTDGKETAKVLKFERSIQKRTGGWGPAYLLNFGHPNISTYMDADMFLKQFSIKEG